MGNGGYMHTESLWFYLGVWHRSVGHGRPLDPPYLPHDAVDQWKKGWTDADQVKISSGGGELEKYGASALAAVKRLAPAAGMEHPDG